MWFSHLQTWPTYVWMAQNISLPKLLCSTWRSWHQRYHQPRNRASASIFKQKSYFWTVVHRRSSDSSRWDNISSTEIESFKCLHVFSKLPIMSMRNCAAKSLWAGRAATGEGCLKTTAAPHEKNDPAVTPFPWNAFPKFPHNNKVSILSMNSVRSNRGRCWRDYIYWRHLEPGKGKHDNVLDAYMLWLPMTACIWTVDALIKSLDI